MGREKKKVSKKGGQSDLRLIKRYAEFRTKEDLEELPRYIRGIYVLFKSRKIGRKNYFDVVYIGMASRKVKGRLRKHVKNKGKHWTHFSVFEVWKNIRDEEIRELEGILRHIYWKDSNANKLNLAKSFKKLKRLRNNKIDKWKI